MCYIIVLTFCPPTISSYLTMPVPVNLYEYIFSPSQFVLHFSAEKSPLPQKYYQSLTIILKATDKKGNSSWILAK